MKIKNELWSFDLYYSFYNPFFCIFIQLFLFIVLDLEESF